MQMIPNKKTIDLFKKLNKLWLPPKKITVSEWADQYRKLSRESSAEPGQWRTRRAPYQREMMDAVTDSSCEKVIYKTSAQIGKTEILLNVLGYFIDQDPGPSLFGLPTTSLAASFSKDRLAPMIRDSATLRDKVRDPKTRDSGNTVYHKKFTGGQLTIIGSNSESELSARPIRMLLCDEVDRWGKSLSEGDPINLAIKRTNNFSNRKIVLASTPTIKGASRIDTEYECSSKERWHVACPECQEHSFFEFGNLKFTHNKEDDSVEIKGFLCEHCGTISSEKLWKKQPGKWIAEFPDNKKVRGFYINELSSPWRTWQQVVEDFIEAKKSPDTLKVWVNTSLGESWEEYGDIDADALLCKRREMYNSEVPNKVVCLTAAVDTQDNRLEYEIVGWGVNKESYGIKYGVIMGDPRQPHVWDMLDMVLDRPYVRADNQALQIMSTCIDSGGHCTDEVYAYCKKNEHRRIWAIKGRGGIGVPYIQHPKSRNDKGVYLFSIGVDVGKDIVTGRLKVEYPGNAGFCHFPMDEGRGYDESYFQGLTSERRVVKYSKGKATIFWEKRTTSARNEPFDIRNYATAALEILNPDLVMLGERVLSSDINDITQIRKSNAVVKRRGVINKGL